MRTDSIVDPQDAVGFAADAANKTEFEMYGLFVSLADCSMEPLDSMEIVLFADEDSAYRWAAERLVENGYVCDQSDGGFSIVGELEEFDSAEEVVREWANGLGSTEYFHVVEVRDAR